MHRSVRAGLQAVRKYRAFQVLVLDEWLLSRPDDGFRRFLIETFELHYDERSTIFCTQCRQKDWRARLDADVTAEAVMGRIVLKTAWVGIGEMNMRAVARTAVFCQLDVSRRGCGGKVGPFPTLQVPGSDGTAPGSCSPDRS